MKSFIVVALLFAAVPLRAQLTLEHAYPHTHQFALVEVDSAKWKYILYNGKDSLSIFNLDHSLERLILVSSPIPWLALVEKRLFDLDTSYEILFAFTGSIALVKENGSVLFQCDTCILGDEFGNINNPRFKGFENTTNGAKMVVTRNVQSQYSHVEVYSLPGKLLQSCAVSRPIGATPFDVQQIGAIAYPNPSSGRVRIAYDLPSGVQSGEIVLTASDGREVKRYHITNAFNDLLIEEGDLPAGSYFYKIVTARGESAAQRIVREK